MKKTRVIWVDIAKGLSILLIVFSHSPMEPLVSPFFYWIKSCRVPVFFFLSGIVFDEFKNSKDNLRAKSRAILSPYFVFASLAVVSSAILNGSGEALIIKLLGVLYGSFFYLEWGPHWFLPQLFIVVILGHFIINKLRSNTCFLLLLSTFLLIFGWLLMKLYWKFECERPVIPTFNS